MQNIWLLLFSFLTCHSTALFYRRRYIFNKENQFVVSFSWLMYIWILMFHEGTMRQETAFDFLSNKDLKHEVLLTVMFFFFFARHSMIHQVQQPTHL